MFLSPLLDLCFSSDHDQEDELHEQPLRGVAERDQQLQGRLLQQQRRQLGARLGGRRQRHTAGCPRDRRRRQADRAKQATSAQNWTVTKVRKTTMERFF